MLIVDSARSRRSFSKGSLQMVSIPLNDITKAFAHSIKGGLFLSEDIPKLPSEWSDIWPDWSVIYGCICPKHRAYIVSCGNSY